MSFARSSLIVLFAFAGVASAQESTDAVDRVTTELSAAAGAPVSVTRSRLTRLASFVATRRGHPIPLPGEAATAEARARAFVDLYGRAFGLADASALETTRVREGDEVGMDHVRMRQVYQGVMVTGAELVVHLRGGSVVAVNGRTLADLAGVDMTPTLSRAAAGDPVRALIEKRRGITDASLSEPRLEVLNRGLLGGVPFPTRLAWFVEARREDLRDFAWIDARTGTVLLHFSQLTDAKNRKIYDGNNAAALPGTLIRTEGGAATGDSDADNAYLYLGDTYDYYFANHGRDSYDNAGGALKATVHHCPSPTDCPYQNAFWNGSQMVFGEGFSAADDVDAHELTHAVTEREANLFYYMQSGAMNESFSDIFGETVDLGNGSGTDTPGVRWEMGEDVPGLGAIRDMMDPTLFGDPGELSGSAEFKCEAPGGDGGGVHSNSGVPNHAYALMVDGGVYNSITVTGIGLTKAAKVEYRALTQYLTSASDFLDDYDALKQSCTDLIGTAGISAGDCTQVGNALDAVEMSDEWPCTPTQGEVPSLCDAGLTPKNVFFDDVEAGGGKWVTQLGVKKDFGNVWFVGSPFGVFATSGKKMLWGYDPDLTNDSSLVMANKVTIPSDAKMQFSHSFGFDNFLGIAYDGGVIEYSAGGGPWTDAGSLIADGAGYNATVFGGDTNPLANQSTFGFASWGYTATQLDLSPLAGQQVKFRFRIGADSDFDDYGWFIDDVSIYTCIPPPSLSISDASVKEGNTGTKNATFTVTLSSASTNTVTVHYATADGTATTADSDYTNTSGNLSFAPGVTSQTVKVPVIGDKTVEANETFFVNLSIPINATLADSQGVGTITNDDLPPPTLSINDASGAEGSAAFPGKVKFTVTLSAASTRTVTVAYITATGTATEGTDYKAKSGTLSFDPGIVKKTIKISVIGDSGPESDESFVVNLSSPNNATLADSQGVGTILNDDGP